MKEGGYIAIQAPLVAALAELVHNDSGDRVAVFLGETPGTSLGLDAPECVGERVHKVVGSSLQKGRLRSQKGPVTMERDQSHPR